MLLEKVNLQQKLEKYRSKKTSPQEILEQVRVILARDKAIEQRILEPREDDNLSEITSFDFDLVEAERIFHITHIEKLSIDYRLRFLPAGLFKGPVPQEAIDRVKQLEREHNTVLKGFHLVAPSKNFKLKNADDPLLFSAMGNGYYYLVHKWGTDLHPLRKVMVWPLKSIENLVVFTVVFSFLFTFVLRELFFASYRETSEFIMLFFFNFKSMVALLVFYGVALGKNFNKEIWRSRYFNN